MYRNIPEELHSIRQWTYSVSNEDKNTLRQPVHAKSGPGGALYLQEAYERANIFDLGLSYGFYTTKEDPYILGDLDGVERIEDMWEYMPASLAYLLKKYPTYMEVSPSGKGIRFIYKFESKEVKAQFSRRKFSCIDKTDGQDVYVCIGKPWVRMTGNTLSISTDEITVIPLEELDKSFGLSETLKDAPIKTLEQIKEEAETVPFHKLKAALLGLPQDKNPRIRRAFKQTFRTEYKHYDYWINVMMAMHHYADMYPDEDVNCLSAFVAWSKKDIEGFESEDDIIRHWKSFTSTDRSITFHSILSLDAKCRIRWPRPKKQTKEEQEANMPLQPSTVEYANFEALINFFDISIYRDVRSEHTLYMKGDEDIITKHFATRHTDYHLDKYFGPFSAKEFVPLFAIFMQSHEFRGVKHTTVKDHVSGYLVKTLLSVDIFKIYLDTPYDKLPLRYQTYKENYSKSTFDELFSCLELNPRTDDPKETDLYKRYYKCWLMGIPRALYYDGENKINNCCLILSGVEQKGKSTHFHRILPQIFRDLIALIAHQFGEKNAVRDISKIASTKLVVYWDEVDRHLNKKSESNYKTIIDNSEQRFIDKYEVKESSACPQAIYGGCTNKWSIEMSNSGARRTFFIPIKSIDTEKMKSLCHHAIFNELKDEMLNALKHPTLDPQTGWQIMPWLLTTEELEYQAYLQYNITQRSDVGIILDEVYDTEAELEITSEGMIAGVTNFQTDKTGTFKSLRMIQRDILNAGFDLSKITNTELLEELHIICGRYTRTERKAKYIKKPACRIEKGLARMGNRKMWVVPPVYCFASQDKNYTGKEFENDRAAFA